MTARLDPLAPLVLDTDKLIDIYARALPREEARRVLRMTDEQLDRRIQELTHAAIVYCGWTAKDKAQ